MFNFTPSELKAVIFVVIVLLVSGTYQLISPHRNLQPIYNYSESDSIFKRISKDTIITDSVNNKILKPNISKSSKNLKSQKLIKNTPKKEDLLPLSININTASEKELQKLPRIGPAMAKRIIEYRTTNGKYNKIEDLLNVKGIGEKTLDKLKPYLIII